jgi:hypothetical protein
MAAIQHGRHRSCMFASGCVKQDAHTAPLPRSAFRPACCVLSHLPTPPGMQVGKDHLLQDEDIVQLVKKI